MCEEEKVGITVVSLYLIEVVNTPNLPVSGLANYKLFTWVYSDAQNMFTK